MIRFIGDFEGHRYEVSDAAGAAPYFDRLSTRFLVCGERGQSIHLGRLDSAEKLPLGLDEGDVDLWIDIDVDIGRAALHWLPDGTYAVELAPAEPLAVQQAELGGLISVPAALARVSAATARRAALEYASTGLRPTGLDWVTDTREWPPGRWGLSDKRGLDFCPESEDELVHGLDKIDKVARRDGHPVIALLVSEIGVEGAPCLWLVLGRDESALEYETGGGESAVSKGPDPGEEIALYAHHGPVDAVTYSRWTVIPRDAAYTAAREFYRTKARPTCVEWDGG